MKRYYTVVAVWPQGGAPFVWGPFTSKAKAELFKRQSMIFAEPNNKPVKWVCPVDYPGEPDERIATHIRFDRKR